MTISTPFVNEVPESPEQIGGNIGVFNMLHVVIRRSAIFVHGVR